MAKRLNGEDMDGIIDHLNRQDKTLNEILIVLRGSVSLGVEGIVSKQSNFEDRLVKLINELAHYERWRQKMISDKGKITFSWKEGIKNAFTFIGAAGTFIAALLTLKQWFEQ